MNHKHEHSHSSHQNHKRPIHRDWRFLVAVGLMLVAMIVYILTMDESILPGGGVQPRVPADAAP